MSYPKSTRDDPDAPQFAVFRKRAGRLADWIIEHQTELDAINLVNYEGSGIRPWPVTMNAAFYRAVARGEVKPEHFACDPDLQHDDDWTVPSCSSME